MKIISCIIFLTLETILGLVVNKQFILQHPKTRTTYGVRHLGNSALWFSDRFSKSKIPLREPSALFSSYFSLDRTVLPSGSLPLHMKLFIIVVTAISSFFAKSLSSRKEMADISYTAKNISTFLGSSVTSSIAFMKTGFFPRLSLLSRIVAAKSSVIIDNAVDTMTRLFDVNASEELDIKEWQQCVVEERELLPGGYIRYRFKLKNRNGILPLYMGQEVVMCAVDNNDRVHKETFFPVSPPNARGHFDVIMRRMGDSIRDKFVRTLDLLALGDDLAFKSGRYRLNYQGEDDPIRYSTMVVSGLGITPALQMLRGVLPGKDSTVEEVEMVWVNEDKADFLCHTEMQNLEYGYIEKMKVTRVIQTDLFGKDVTENDVMRSAISDYEPGRIAVVCGPDYVVTKVRSFFQDIGYPVENIMCVVIP